nr:hypothetical protein [Tanacetum cinerariifolium]
QLMAVKKTSFPEIGSSGSIVVNIPGSSRVRIRHEATPDLSEQLELSHRGSEPDADTEKGSSWSCKVSKQLMVVKKTSFPEIGSSGSIVVNIPGSSRVRIRHEATPDLSLDLSKVTITLRAKALDPSFGIQQVEYLQHEHYALWEVIEFGYSYKGPPKETVKDKGLACEVSASTKKKRRTVAITAGDMLQAIVSHLKFMDVPIKQDNLNQKFLTSLAPEWLVYIIVWRNRDDLDTMSLDDVYNHLKVYEPEVQKRVGSNSQNMAFISSLNTSSGKSEVLTVQGVSTASAQVSTDSTDVAAASLSYDTTGKKNTIQGSDVAYFDKSKVECLNCHKIGHFARECRSPRSQDREKRESYKKDPKVEEPAPKATIAIDGIGWDWSYIAEKDDDLKNHALVADEEKVLTEYALMAKSSLSADNEVYNDSFCSKSRWKNTKNLNTKISKLNEELGDYEADLYNYKRESLRDIELKDNKIEYLMNELEEVKKEKESIDFKIEKFENASKDINRLLWSKKLDKDKKGMGFNEYCDVPPPPVQVYSPPKKDLSWMGLSEFVDATVTDYTRPTPRGSSGNVVSKPMIKFVKESGCPNATKVNNTKNARKPTVKYVEMYRNTSQSPRGILHDNIDDKGSWDSGCSRHMTGNISYLSEYEPFNEDMCHLVMEDERLLGSSSECVRVPSLGADETAFLTKYARYGEAFPTATSLDAGQDRGNIAKTSAMPHEASPRVTFLGGGEGRCSKYGGMDKGEDLLVWDTVKDSDKSADKGSDNTDDMANVLGTLGAKNILASRGLRSFCTIASLSVVTASTIVSPPVATASQSFPNAVIFTTASVGTPTTRVTRSSRGVVIESSSSISLARDLEAKFDQEDQIIREQAERDSEIAMIHTKRELEMMIAELDRSNETVAKYLSEYEQAEAGLSHDKKVELIDELLMYQRNLAQIKKYQAQQNKPATKTERRDFYMSILRSNAGWKAKDFKGMTFE